MTERTARIHRAVLTAIADYTTAHRYNPTTRDLQTVLGYESTSTMHTHLVNMRSLGYIDWVEACPRTLHIVDSGFAFLAGGDA